MARGILTLAVAAGHRAPRGLLLGFRLAQVARFARRHAAFRFEAAPIVDFRPVRQHVLDLEALVHSILGGAVPHEQVVGVRRGEAPGDRDGVRDVPRGADRSEFERVTIHECRVKLDLHQLVGESPIADRFEIGEVLDRAHRALHGVCSRAAVRQGGGCALDSLEGHAPGSDDCPHGAIQSLE